MKKRSDKEKDLAFLRGEFENLENLFLTGYEKMTVEQDFQLRKAVRAAGGEYRVIKNNLAQKASQGLNAEPLFEQLAGMTSIAYTKGDVVALAKALKDYAKANPVFTFKAGLVEGRVIDVAGITELASMPSKEEIYAKLLYVINAPAQQLVTVMNAVGRDLAVVVDQGVQKEKFQA